MWQLPPTPTWDSLHPIVTHFPIVLLLVAPVFVVLALLPWRQRWTMAGIAAAVMVVAATLAWVAVSTGEAAGELALRDPQVNPVLELHEELAETTAQLATVCAAGFVLLIAVVAVVRRKPWRQPVWVAGCILVLGVQGVTALAVTNTGHNGGRLVHEFGVRALLPAEPQTGAQAVTDSRPVQSHDEQDED